MRYVIDVGASYGSFAKFIAERSFENIRVIAVEPLQDIAAQIPKLPNLKVIVSAVRSQDKILDDRVGNFSRAKNSELSSFLSVNDQIDKNLWASHLTGLDTEIIPVNLLTLKEIIKESGFPKVDFLKIDTQGTDFEVFISAEDEISKIMSCVLEFPYNRESSIYADELDISEGINLMKENGFTCIRLVPNGGGECNAFFVNDLIPISEYFEMEEYLGFNEAPTLKLTHNSLLNLNVVQRLGIRFGALVFKFIRKYKNI